MKENMILAYLHREAVDFNIDDFMAMFSFDMLLTHEEELPLIPVCGGQLEVCKAKPHIGLISPFLA